jgi:hypothetical protein
LIEKYLSLQHKIIQNYAATKLEQYVWKSLTRGPTADNENVELCGLERGNLVRAGGEGGVRAHINSIHSAHTKPVLKQGVTNI